MKSYPHHPVYYIPSPKSQKELFAAKKSEGPDAPKEQQCQGPLIFLIDSIRFIILCCYFFIKKTCHYVSINSTKQISHLVFCINFTKNRSPLFALILLIRCHSLYHSLSLNVPLVAIRCHSMYHLLPLNVPLVVSRYHLMYHSLSLVTTRCTIRLSLYKRSVFPGNFNELLQCH